MQLPSGAVVDSSGKQTIGIPLSSLGGGQIIQQQVNSTSQPQIIATAGPGGNLTYNVVQPFQTINVEGQEAIIIPSSMASGNGGQIIGANQPQQQQQQTLFATPSGQIIRAAASGIAAATSNVIPNLGTVVNLGGNMVNLGNVQGMQQARPNILQALQSVQPQNQIQMANMSNFIQIPMSTANGQTIMQTVQIPVQGTGIPASAFQPGQQFTTTDGGLTTTAGQTQTTVTSSAIAGQTVQVQQQPQYIEIQANPNIGNQIKGEDSNSKPSTPQQTVNTQQTNQQQPQILQQNSAGQTILTPGQAITPNILSHLPTLVLNAATGQLIPVSNTGGQSFVLGSGAQTNVSGTNTVSVASSPQQTNMQGIVAPQQFATLQMPNQTVGGLQIAGQNQVINPWLSAINMANIRPQGVQTISVPNLQTLQNVQGLQNIQNSGLQGFQLTPQGQLIATGNNIPQGLGTVTLTPQGTLTVATQSNQQQTSPQSFPATVTNINLQQGTQAVNAAQLQNVLSKYM